MTDIFHTLATETTKVAAADAKNDGYTQSDLIKIQASVDAGQRVDINRLSNPNSTTLQAMTNAANGLATTTATANVRNSLGLQRSIVKRRAVANSLLTNAKIALADDQALRANQKDLQGQVDTIAAATAKQQAADAAAAAANVPKALSTAETTRREQTDVNFSQAKQTFEEVAKDPTASKAARDQADASAAVADKAFAAKLQAELQRSEDARRLLVEEQTKREEQARVDREAEKQLVIAQRIEDQRVERERKQGNLNVKRKDLAKEASQRVVGSGGKKFDAFAEAAAQRKKDRDLKLKSGVGIGLANKLGGSRR